MKVLSTLLASALLAVSAGAASADTIASYGNAPGTATPTGVSNTALASTKGTTYNIGTGNVWTAPVGNSSWVSINKNDYPGGGHVEPNGVYTYTTTFNGVSNDSGSLTVLADDTTDVYFNGVKILDAAAFTGAAHCTAGTPNCITPVTVALTGFLTGTNVLSFDVDQLFLHATGIDFAGSYAVTPEPSSLLLMGSGLTGMAGMFFRRRKQA